VDESPRQGEGGPALTERLARDKAAAVRDHDGLPVLGADTTVVCDARLLGKPASLDDARTILRLLSGRSHEVVTGVCLAQAGRLRSAVEVTAVTFAPLSDEEIDWYVATGEPMDKAGAYHIDGRGALLVSAVHGSPSNVAGLPVPLLYRLLREAGVRLS
jgi:septum formation protein